MMTYITNDYKGRLALAGMSHKDSMTLARMLNPEPADESRFETVAQYIERTGCKTETRTSKKGTKLIKVFYHTGDIKEYPMEHLERTCTFIPIEREHKL